MVAAGCVRRTYICNNNVISVSDLMGVENHFRFSAQYREHFGFIMMYVLCVRELCKRLTC